MIMVARRYMSSSDIYRRGNKLKLVWKATNLLFRHALFLLEVLLEKAMARLGKGRDGKVYICITVDGDAHGIPNALEKGMPLLFKIFDRNGLSGKVTWFINERYDWTGTYPHLLQQILYRGDRLEVHCHIESLIARDDFVQIYDEIARDRQKIESFSRRYLPNYRISCFRSGSGDRSVKMMQALEELGFSYDSSITPGESFDVYGKMISDKDVPRSRNCYFLRPEEYKVPSNKPTQIVELPVYNALYGTPRLREKEKESDYPIVITNLIHPYNLVKKNGEINKPVKLAYEWVVALLRMIPNSEFVTLLQAGEAWRKSHS